MTEAGGGRREWGKVEINQQATPTVHCLWGVETCMYFTELGRASSISEFNLIIFLKLIFFFQLLNECCMKHNPSTFKQINNKEFAPPQAKLFLKGKIKQNLKGNIN